MAGIRRTLPSHYRPSGTSGANAFMQIHGDPTTTEESRHSPETCTLHSGYCQMYKKRCSHVRVGRCLNDTGTNFVTPFAGFVKKSLIRGMTTSLRGNARDCSEPEHLLELRAIRKYGYMEDTLHAVLDLQ